MCLCLSAFRLTLEAVLLGIVAGFLSAVLGVGGCQTDGETLLVNLKIFAPNVNIVLGHPAEVGVLLGVCRKAIEGYATKTYVDDMLGDIESLLGGI